ncbi:hypothetical protein [Bradyrhizobium paxllaeri]|uniref:hypothetical protein n=1 Tax=Bradyrhizobium paxllaeri TaxID=190148 RepID=UPI0011468B19|nr:hypothetical protein [Bradyrhizobium paxllaeri]
MKAREPIPLEEQLRERMNLTSEAIAAAARDGEVEEYAALLTSLLQGFEHNYIQSRLYEEARALRETYEHVSPSEEWRPYYENGDGGWREGIWDELFPRRRGQQGHDTLLMIYDLLRKFWEQLPADSRGGLREKRIERGTARKAAERGKRSARWAPRFEWDWVEKKSAPKSANRSTEIPLSKELIAHNPSAKLLLAVAKIFDRNYSPKNCRSVDDRAKNLRRSPEGRANLAERRRRAAAKSRAKGQQ